MRVRAFLLSLMLAACSNGVPGGAQPTASSTGASSPPGATSPASGTTVKACDLLTPAELSSATGVAGLIGTETDAIAGQFSCSYVAADGTPGANDTVITPASPISPTKTYDSFAQGAETLTGIGDRAIWASLPGTDVGSLYAMVGDNLFTLSVLTTTPDTAEQRKSVTLELGKLAASRLR